MVLNFDINSQARGGGSHYHSNSTSFTLSALRRKWVIDRGFHVAETKDNSLILIDGRGQGFFPLAARPRNIAAIQTSQSFPETHRSRING